MKRFFCIIIIIILILGACAAPALNTSAAPSESQSESPSPSPSDTVEDNLDDFLLDPYSLNSQLATYYKDDISDADNCHVRIGDTEYYFDTEKIVQMDFSAEFPLYRDTPSTEPEYLGTTGYAFTVNGNYIYVKSDIQSEDFPENEITRVVNLKTLTVTDFQRGVNIYVSPGGKVYYTRDIGSAIYTAGPSLNKSTKLPVTLPDKKQIEKAINQKISDLYVSITITGVQNGYIYFTYEVFELQGWTYYKGGYRISVDGKKIKKTDDGEYKDVSADSESNSDSDTETSDADQGSGD